jgi:hypothetical protein
MFYYPYPANDGKHKYYVITPNNKKIYFGAYGYNDYTTYYKTYGKKIADERKLAYLKRHQENENWGKSGINTKGFWSANLLWGKPTIEASYNDIKKRFLK